MTYNFELEFRDIIEFLPSGETLRTHAFLEKEYGLPN